MNDRVWIATLMQPVAERATYQLAGTDRGCGAKRVQTHILGGIKNLAKVKSPVSELAVVWRRPTHRSADFQSDIVAHYSTCIY